VAFSEEKLKSSGARAFMILTQCELELLLINVQ
jgi:hypothetical protein